MSWGPDVEHCRPSQIQQYDINGQFLRAKEVHAKSRSGKKSGNPNVKSIVGSNKKC